ncbi:MAG: AAA family ATPase, partial [Proteobacteria bacterium]|nr:AAA family ATPase [Pseudomonadota bacterium]
VRRRDATPVILKKPSNKTPVNSEIARFHHAYDILNSISIPQVIKVYDLEVANNIPLLVMEDWGGISLDKYCHNRPLDLKIFFKIALQKIEILRQLHSQGITHKNIHPGNIVWNPQKEKIQLIDFLNSSKLNNNFGFTEKGDTHFDRRNHIAPERSGLFNGTADYRSDYFSVGATFYELLTGEVPELLSGLNEPDKNLLSPHQLNQGIPEALSDIVMKLLAISPEDRYQGTYGMRQDIEQCEQQYLKAGRIETFPYCQNDVVEHFPALVKLYEREQQLLSMVASYNAIPRSGNKILLISGSPGVGKTRLVQEFKKTVHSENAYFLTGKFDQFHKNVPYTGIVALIKDLIAQLLNNNNSQLQNYKSTLLKAMGANSGIMTEFVPALERIIGKQPKAAEIDSRHIVNRFHQVFQDFLSVFTNSTDPLVIFLDDLQWADRSSLDLVENFISNENSGSIMLVGAHRDTLVHQAHPILNSVVRLKKRLEIDNFKLEPLCLESIHKILAGNFQINSHKSRTLSDYIHKKTGGNPLFLDKFLGYLERRKLFTFDPPAGVWHWELRKIIEAEVGTNVIDLLRLEWGEYTPQQRVVISTAACMGADFDIKHLAKVLKKPVKEVDRLVWEFVLKGILLPLDKTYEVYRASQIFNELLEDDEVKGTFLFLHDTFQQAAKQVIPEDDRGEIHRKIGQVLSEDTRQNRFEILTHQNLGIGTLDPVRTEDINDLIDTNYKAGINAQAIAAPEASLLFLKKAIDLLGEEGWEKDYPLAQKIHQKAIESACLCENFSEMEIIVQKTEPHLIKNIHKANLLEQVGHADFAKHDPHNAVSHGMRALRLLNHRIHKNPGYYRILFQLFKTRIPLFNKPVRVLENIEELKNVDIGAVMHLATQLAHWSLKGAPVRVSIIIFKLVGLTIKYGIAAESAYIFARYGMIHCISLGQPKEGNRFGKLALALNNRPISRKYQVRTSFLVENMIRPTRYHLNSTLAPMLAVQELAMKDGDVEYALKALNAFYLNSFQVGTPLEELEEGVANYSSRIPLQKEDWQHPSENMLCYLIADLRGIKSEGNPLDEDESSLLGKESVPMTIFDYYLFKMMRCYYFEDYTQALELAGQIHFSVVMIDTKLATMSGLELYLAL